MQYNFIKESDPPLKTISHGIPQSFVLGPFSFIFFSNNMHNSGEYCKVHHYTNDTNLLLTDNSLKKIIDKYIMFFH